MDRDHLIYTPRSQPSQRLSAGADYLLDASTRLSRVGAGHNEVLMDFGGGVTGTLWASQIAIGHECDSGIYVIGTEGSLEWTATT